MSDTPEKDVNGDAGVLTAEQIEAEFANYPAPVLEKYRKARSELNGRIADETLQQWAAEGLLISRKTVRSWEAAAEYFEASPGVQRQLPSGQFLRWGRTGSSLADDSPALAVAFFRASPDAMLRLRPRYIDDWASVTRSLYRGTWKSSGLACKFFENTPKLLESVSFDEFCHFGEFLEVLSRRSYDAASESLDASLDLFPRLGPDVDRFVSLARTVAETSWRDVKALFDAAAGQAGDLPSQQRVQLLALARRLASSGEHDIGTMLKDGAAATFRVPADSRDRLLELTNELAAVSVSAAPEFLRTAPNVLERVTFDQFVEWHSAGMRVSRENEDAAGPFFRLESATASEVLDSLSSSVELNRVRDIVRMYCQAISGREIEVNAAQQLVDKNIGWFQGELPTTEGSTIYLPSVINRFGSKDENFNFFKVIATHQAGHIEFGSFGFDFTRPSGKFEDIRSDLPGARKLAEEARRAQELIQQEESAEPSVQPAEADAGGDSPTFVTDMSRFFDLFPDNRLARDVFTVVESSRVDTLILDHYRGLAVPFKSVQQAALETRPSFEELPAREALVEFMIRWSLGQEQGMRVPGEHADAARQIRRLLRRISSPDANVEDAAEATIRIYSILSDISNEEVDEEDFQDLEPENESEGGTGEEDAPGEEDRDMIMQQFMNMSQEGQGEETAEGEVESEEGQGEETYESPQQVDYRGEFKPELSQLLSQMQMSEAGEGGEDGEMQQLTAEQLEQMLKENPEMEIQQSDEEGEGEESQQQQQMSEMLENLLKELSRRDPENQQMGQQSPPRHVDEDGGPLEAVEANTFTYDEWDFRAHEYKPRWCLVHEKEMADGEQTFFRETLTENAGLVQQIRRQFELVMPEQYRKQKRLEDGEEADLDATLEALIDLRSGVTPDEKIYWRRNKTERSVAVAFLLDMSASTAEAIDESRRGGDDWGAPDDPVEYMVWLRSRRAEGLRRSYKRIVDVEKEGIVLLINALEMIGDDYGIYGFSGYGRENVEYYVIKDIDEKFNYSTIPGRIDRIAPLHATRMGPAIRHTTAKLAEHESRSRFLFLISDGRPQDRGYSREGVEKEYAVHDTRQALVEARQQGITPFCLTVDKAGHDYLKTMMQDFSYEVLPDIRQLPKRLPLLYRNLTRGM